MLGSPHPAVFVCWAPTGRLHIYRLCVCFPVFKQLNRKEQIIAEDFGLLFLHQVSLVNRRHSWLKTTRFAGCETRAGSLCAVHCCCPIWCALPLVGIVCGLPIRLLPGEEIPSQTVVVPTLPHTLQPCLRAWKVAISSPNWRYSLMWNWDRNRLALV